MLRCLVNKINQFQFDVRELGRLVEQFDGEKNRRERERERENSSIAESEQFTSVFRPRDSKLRELGLSPIPFSWMAEQRLSLDTVISLLSFLRFFRSSLVLLVLTPVFRETMKA